MAYRNYFLRKFFTLVLTLFIITLVNFVLFRLLPGDPIMLLFRDPRLTPEQINYLYHKFGLDKPLWEQFFVYLWNLLRGEWGISFAYKKPIMEILIPRIINSLILVIPATVLSIILGVATGVVAAWKRGGLTDAFVSFVSLGLYSLPTFWLGGIFVFLSINYWRLPVGGMLNYGVDHNNALAYLGDLFAHIALPLATLTLVSYGSFTLTVRGALLDVLSEDYIRTAVAKGLSSWRVLSRHALPNAMLPTVSLTAVSLGTAVTGSVLTETVFNWPGVGRLIFDAISNRDYPLLQAGFLVITVSVLLANFLADIVYGLLDPRVKYR
ncbi:ABC-type dipeptide/oligopeptide/nickel transport systems, permease component [Thermogladius calderae 1633]|uniref:ABC-type dipeptide/oligopeptide/nickel transport systems, permease component n=1 Tax=Thermogladius calderae (strain DSM 22663 / VKM B-2946 / 1633) TaxID=1184251 RepID=I3TFU2_THEC1|nr:ABC transporter permease [Thermogladius calderae]AFK51630.1 ABC-type dipeptide/oligopeptide/nickel transport systems, permease component [Thermogladius calderae 1633]